MKGWYLQQQRSRPAGGRGWAEPLPASCPKVSPTFSQSDIVCHRSKCVFVLPSLVNDRQGWSMCSNSGAQRCVRVNSYWPSQASTALIGQPLSVIIIKLWLLIYVLFVPLTLHLNPTIRTAMILLCTSHITINTLHIEYMKQCNVHKCVNLCVFWFSE